MKVLRPGFITALATSLLAVTVPTPIAHADFCNWQGIATHSTQLGDGSAANTFYLDDEGVIMGWGEYVYQESNGIFTPYEPGVGMENGAASNLQRGGVSEISGQDGCTLKGIPPDTYLF